ncbi:hypothetical protein DFH94DRAFT_858311 [Russula ochroleuca]|uniref:Uncharacterized protein n=1 Tax=Russula ochroleuca TaxID=152965 RepID=A0A9P5JSX9_9AGAM|nr:hypothetical protein DFH94DRAFT_858311 [Russula ochroleuca]
MQMLVLTCFARAIPSPAPVFVPDLFFHLGCTSSRTMQALSVLDLDVEHRKTYDSFTTVERVSSSVAGKHI